MFVKFGGSINPQKEEYYRKEKKRRNTKDAFFRIFKFLLVIIVILLIIFILYTWNFIIKKILNNYLFLNNIKSLSESLFNIQATISTLTIAIISIFSGFMKEKIFGYSIIKFILFKKNYPFSIYNTSIFLMILILVSAFFILTEGYFICFFLFIITILGIIYITKETFKLLGDYDKIVVNIRDNTLQELKKNFDMLDYIETEEENIEYILEEYRLKSIHENLDNYIMNLYDDTVRKINEEDFNSYCINIKMFIDIISKIFNFINMNKLKKDIYTTLIQRIDALFYILMKQKQYNLALDILLALNSTMREIVQRRNLSHEDKENVKHFFNLYNYINSFIIFLGTKSIYNREYVDTIKWIIFNQDYYIMNSIELSINANYDEDNIYKNIFDLLFIFYISICKNKFYTIKEKEETEKWFFSYKEEYDKLGTWWGNFLDYRTLTDFRNSINKISKEGKLTTEKLSNDIDKETYNKVLQAVNSIKRRLLRDINNIIDKGK